MCICSHKVVIAMFPQQVCCVPHPPVRATVCPPPQATRLTGSLMLFTRWGSLCPDSCSVDRPSFPLSRSPNVYRPPSSATNTPRVKHHPILVDVLLRRSAPHPSPELSGSIHRTPSWWDVPRWPPEARTPGSSSPDRSDPPCSRPTWTASRSLQTSGFTRCY